MSHDDIRAALESRSDLPWRPSHDGPVATRPSDTYDVLDNDGETVAASLFYLDAHLIANAPTWLAELLAENERLRDSIQHYADTLALHECERPEIERLTDENDRLRLADDYKPEGVDIVMAKLRDYRRRAEAAEQTVRRVRGLAGELRAKHYLAPTATADAILRALDGGAS